MKPVIVITGKDGQLGWELDQLISRYPEYEMLAFNRAELDITDEQALQTVFLKHRPSFFINAAAYTAVDRAESDQESAYRINAAAVGTIATLCQQYESRLITVSTDYVFNGAGSSPYSSTHPIEPVNYYGYTKAVGEQLALANCKDTIVIRTSWVYSSHGSNFVKTMMRLMRERETLNVVADQHGCPTYARDLATAIMDIVIQGANHPGVFHFSNAGETTWFSFALAIKDAVRSDCRIMPISSDEYKTAAKRPFYSVMDCSAIAQAYDIHPRHWHDALAECIREIAELERIAQR